MAKVVSNFAVLLARKEQQDRRRYTQKEVAESIGISESMVSRLLKDVDVLKMSYGNILKVAQWLDCTSDELVKLVEE